MPRSRTAEAVGVDGVDVAVEQRGQCRAAPLSQLVDEQRVRSVETVQRHPSELLHILLCPLARGGSPPARRDCYRVRSAHSRSTPASSSSRDPLLTMTWSATA